MNICPKCGKKVKLKEGRFGLFYGCTGFPKCNFTVDYEVFTGDDFDLNRYEDYEHQRDLDGYLIEIING